MDKKKIVIIFILIVLISGIYYYYPNLFNTLDDLIVASGTIEANSVDITAIVPGQIIELNIKSGEKVEQGQDLARIERNDLEAQRERDAMGVLKAEARIREQDAIRAQSQASLQSAQSSLSQAEAGVAISKSMLEQAEAGKNINIINLQIAKLTYERIKALYEAGAASQSHLEETQRQMEILQSGSSDAAIRQSEAGVSQALAVLEQARAGVEKAHANVAQSNSGYLEAELEQVKAVYKISDAILADLIITSPINGVILSKNYELGEYLHTGSKLATIADLEKIYIRVYIPTNDLPYVRLGQNVKILVSGIEREFTGVVEEIADRGEFTPKMIQTQKERANIVFAVKIAAENHEGILKPGMPADVVFGKRG